MFNKGKGVKSVWKTSTEQEASDYIHGMWQQTKVIKMFEALSQIQAFKDYKDELIGRYAFLTGLSQDHTKKTEFRDQMGIRASEIKWQVLNMAVALNKGEELRDPDSIAARELRDKYSEYRNEHKRTQQQG